MSRVEMPILVLFVDSYWECSSRDGLHNMDHDAGLAELKIEVLRRGWMMPGWTVCDFFVACEWNGRTVNALQEDVPHEPTNLSLRFRRLGAGCKMYTTFMWRG